MVHPPPGIHEAGLEVIRFQIWHLVQNLRGIESGGEKVEHIHDSDPHPPHARAASALFGVQGNALK